MSSIKKKNLMISRIVALFLVLNVLSVFSFAYLVILEDEKKSLKYEKVSMQEIVNEKSSLVNITFERIESQMRLLGIWIDKMEGREYSEKLSSDYYYDEDGNIVRKKNEKLSDVDQSNVLIPKDVKKTPQLIRSINETEELDEVFSGILKSEEITWAYITTSDNILRCSPYRVLGDQFSNNHNQRKDLFYTCADETNNPEGDIVWTEPYSDYLGTGWTITCSMPVYDDEKILLGVVSMDVAIKNIVNEYFDGFSIGEKGNCYWLKKNGDLLYSSIDNKQGNHGQPLGKNVFRDDDFSDEKKEAVREVFSKKQEIVQYKDRGKEKMLVSAPIGKLDSLLVIEVDTDEFAQGIKFDLKYVSVIVVMNLIIILIFMVIFYHNFSIPMKKLVKSATKIERGDYEFIQSDYNLTGGCYEIVLLNKAFMAMNQSLENYSDKIRKKNEDISAIVDTIECNLVATDMDGTIKLQTKEKTAISHTDILNAIKNIKEGKEAFSEEKIIDGQVYRNKYYPARDENGEIERIIVYSECITETLLMEKALQQLEKMAGVGQLSAAIVHELKNIMARIDGAAYILSLKYENSQSAEEVEIIKKSIEEAENVITTLLDFSRKESDGKEMIHIETMVNQIVLLSKKELIEKNIKVITDIDKNEYWISGYRESLKVILQNLIINAIQAIDTDGKIWVSCRKEDLYLVIKVRDNGSGIIIEPKEKIFNAFVTSKESGTGIGLWVVKKLIDAFEGKIEVNDPMEGSTEFAIYLPVERGRKNESDNYFISG